MATHYAVEYFRYTESTNTAEVWLDPNDEELVAQERYVFSNGPFELPHDLATGRTLQHEPSIQSLGKFKNSIDPFRDNLGVAFESDTQIALSNIHRYFDDIYNKYIWLNQPLKIYSWSPELDNFTDSKKIFDGTITDSDFTDQSMKFSATNFAYKLRTLLGLDKFTDADGSLTDSSRYKSKRLLYGRVNGSKCTTIDALADGYDFSGTISGTSGSKTITASSGVLKQLDNGATLTFLIADEPIELKVDNIVSDNVFTISESLKVSFSGITPTIQPERPNYYTNRNWHVAIGKLFEVNTTISTVFNGGIFTVPNTTDFNVGDILIWKKGTADETHRTIRRISGNQVTLTQFLPEVPSIGDSIDKIPIIDVFSGTSKYLYQRVGTDRDFNFTNTTSDCIINFEQDAELKVTLPQSIDGTISSASGRNLVVTGGAFTKQLRSRDWIRLLDNDGDLGYYEVLKVIDDNNLTIRDTAFSGTWVASQTLEAKVVDYLDDDSDVAVNCYGKQDTVGNWIKYPAMVVQDLLGRAGITNIDTTSFDDVNEQAYYITSLKLPLSHQGTEVDIRTAIGYMNKSFLMSLFEKNGLVTLDMLNAQRPSANQVPVTDFDAFGDVTIKTETDLYKDIQLNYNHFDVSSNSADSGFEVANSDVSLTQKLIGIDTTKIVDVYMYGDMYAQTWANRFNWFHSRSQQIITVNGRLNLVDFTVHDRVLIQFDRNPLKIGQTDSNYKVAMVTSTVRNGEDVTLVLNDISDWFSVCASITEDTALDYDTSTTKDKAIDGYITSDDFFLSNGANDDDETFQINKIN
jgi:hypothetical protein